MKMDGYQIAIYCCVFAAIVGGLTAILGAYIIKKIKIRTKIPEDCSFGWN